MRPVMKMKLSLTEAFLVSYEGETPTDMQRSCSTPGLALDTMMFVRTAKELSVSSDDQTTRYVRPLGPIRQKHYRTLHAQRERDNPYI